MLGTYYLIVISTAAAPPRTPLKIDDATCRLFQSAVELAGRKWNAAIMLALARGAARFTEITALVAGISDRVLAARLRELETQELIVRQVAQTMPVQVHYQLTPRGHELIALLQPLVGWGARWNVASSDNRQDS